MASLVRDKMKDNATIWISGTHHNIFSIEQILQELDFKILNIVTWEKIIRHPIFHVNILLILQNKLFGLVKKKRYHIITITI